MSSNEKPMKTRFSWFDAENVFDWMEKVNTKQFQQKYTIIIIKKRYQLFALFFASLNKSMEITVDLVMAATHKNWKLFTYFSCW